METSYTKVINQYVRETDKQSYKIKTISGREIIATEDNKFMTVEGWKEVRDCVVNDTLIGIMPNQINLIEREQKSKYLIIHEQEFRNKLIDLGLELSYINKQIKTLEKAQLLPLYSDNYKLPIL